MSLLSLCLLHASETGALHQQSFQECYKFTCIQVQAGVGSSQSLHIATLLYMFTANSITVLIYVGHSEVV